MVKAFKESHEKDVERLAADRRREAESKEAHALKNDKKSRCDIKFVKGLVRKNRALSMSKNDDERIGLCPCPRTMTNSTNS
jgi:hypothetical protein